MEELFAGRPQLEFNIRIAPVKPKTRIPAAFAA
jgi:hypothetical protein